MSKIRQTVNAPEVSAYSILQCVEWVRDALQLLPGYASAPSPSTLLS
jgi:hypothetical protein